MPRSVTDFLTPQEAAQLEDVCTALTSDAVADHPVRLATSAADLVGFTIADGAAGAVVTDHDGVPSRAAWAVSRGLNTARLMRDVSETTPYPDEGLEALLAAAVCLILSLSTAHEAGLAVYTEHETRVVRDGGETRLRSSSRVFITEAGSEAPYDSQGAEHSSSFLSASMH